INVVKGDFGFTIRDRRLVTDVIAERLPMTMELTFFAMTFASVFGILLGLVAALNRNKIGDTLTMILANMGVSMPVFWLGLLLAYFFALILKDTPFYIPPSGRLSPGISLIPLAKQWDLSDLAGLPRFLLAMVSNSAILNGLLTKNWSLVKDALWHLILPSLAVGTISMATIARMTRSSLLDVLGQDYIRAAGDAGTQCQPAGGVPGDFDDDDAVVGVRRAVQAVDGFGGDGQRGIKTDRHFSQRDVIFNGLG
ncbi:MAG: ABC transporter permease, partial [Anaerolineaceae bacterium]